jgi:hypothetical protein
VFPRRPVRHQIGIGDEYARRIRMRGEDADRLARLDQQGFVIFEVAQRFEDGVVAAPVARGAADAAVNDQVFGTLGDFGIEIVLDHPVRGLGQPGLAGSLGAARGADTSGRVVAVAAEGDGGGHGGAPGDDGTILRLSSATAPSCGSAGCCPLMGGQGAIDFGKPFRSSVPLASARRAPGKRTAAPPHESRAHQRAIPSALAGGPSARAIASITACAGRVSRRRHAPSCSTVSANAGVRMTLRLRTLRMRYFISRRIESHALLAASERERFGVLVRSSAISRSALSSSP